MSTNPLSPKVPIPGIVTEPPVPELSVTDHDRRTVWPPPIVTFEGDAVKLLIIGAGHGFAVTVACAEDTAPHPTVTFRL